MLFKGYTHISKICTNANRILGFLRRNISACSAPETRSSSPLPPTPPTPSHPHTHQLRKWHIVDLSMQAQFGLLIVRIYGKFAGLSSWVCNSNPALNSYHGNFFTIDGKEVDSDTILQRFKR